MTLRIFDADFHLHSKYSGATSSRMDIDTIAQQARLKGLSIVGTGDIFHPKWFDSVRSELEEVAEGTFEHRVYGTRFILTVEVEDANRVHHLLFFPSITAVEDLRNVFSGKSSDIDTDGRARVNMSAVEIAEAASDHDCMIGPSHAFTPWTSMYKEFNSLGECYGDRAGDVKFLELGLSADTDMADRIGELQDITFISCSDAHSPWPDKLGREFNRLELEEPTYREVVMAISRKNGRRIAMNVGFDPRLGKYHISACSRCFHQYELKRAIELNWRCEKCRGWIKKGVWDRVNELATYPEPRHPEHRPAYLRIAPLAEVISLALGTQDLHSPAVESVWKKLVERFGSEIGALVDAPVDEIERIADVRVTAMVKAFRENGLRVVPGGGGRYGHLEVPEELVGILQPRSQRKLTEFE
ncbi:MAG: TIGR00375 family protein [Candidatus Hadarchaeales archaeon]